jgi:uncharacterized membrane protein
MGGISRYVLEKLQARTGLGTGVIVGYVLQVALGIASIILLFVAIFFVLADYFALGGTLTSISMLVAVVVLLVGAMLWTNSARKKTIAEAQRALARHSMIGLNPPLLAAGAQVAQKMGWRQALPILVALITASGVAAEWSRRRHHDGHPEY